MELLEFDILQSGVVILLLSVISGFGSAKPEMFGQMLPILVLTLAASTGGVILLPALTRRLLAPLMY